MPTRKTGPKSPAPTKAAASLGSVAGGSEPPPVLAMTQAYDARRPAVDWMADIELRAGLFLSVLGGDARPGAASLRLAIQHAQLARAAVAAGDASSAAAMAAAAMAAVWEAEVVEARMRWFEPHVAPKVAIGQKFRDGRKAGAVGPVRRFVRAYLAKHRDAKARDVWAAMTAKPPRGVEVYQDSGNVKRYARDTATGTSTGWPHFQTIVSEERPKPG